MKIAIFYDWINITGGGEKLVLTLARELGADVLTTDIDTEAIRKMDFEDVNIISIGGTIGFSPIKQILTSIKFSMCDFSKKYDVFIFSGDWSIFASRKHKPNLYYCNSPARLFYDLYEIFLNRQPFITRPIFKIWVALHKRFLESQLKHLEKIIANSGNTQSRIEKYFNIKSEVIFPPIDTSKYHFKESGNFWISVNTLFPDKRVELQIEAFRSLPDEKLIIIGDYKADEGASSYAKKIKSILPLNVEMKNRVSEGELIELYSRCKGHIATARDEDFGMTPVEAMASGKPVVCVREGGYLESVIDGITGYLVEPDAKDIIRAVNIINKNPERYRKACEEQAKKFDKSIFIKRILENLKDV